MKKKLITAAILSVLCPVIILAQTSTAQIYPVPQNSELDQNPQSFSGIKLTQKKWQGLVNRTPVSAFIGGTNQLWKLKLKIKKNYHPITANAVWEGSYQLKAEKNKIQIEARDSVGLFYGLQTLAQMIHGNQITTGEIQDFPTVRYRGVVEGFYGTPWSQADRLSQLKYYGQIKANTYIYGPKDDPYHSSPNWRKPYPPKEAENIKTLVKAANQNFVDFVWAIHPGKDIQWTDEDQNNVLKKFESMYDLGVRSFALFFDDISGEGTKAEKQAGLLNFLNTNFVEKKGDVKPLILTPTDYNKSWAGDGPNSYLKILGKQLDPSIQIMWTGDQVIADVTRSTLDWVNQRIRRPALFWWNFPVSDYTRDHLLLGPSYGLEKDLNSTNMAGVLSNPMEHAEASKPAIFGVADYDWNTSAYDDMAAWKQAIKNLMPKSYKAYELFAENNTDPGNTWSTWHRDESWTVSPYIQRIENGWKSGNVQPSDFSFVYDYFQKIRDTEKTFVATNDDPAMTTEIKPWLNDFTYLGQWGMSTMDNHQILKSGDKQGHDLWDVIVSNYKKSQTIKPTQTLGTEKVVPVTGTAVLRPFVQKLQSRNNADFIQSVTSIAPYADSNPGLGSISTDIASLKQKGLMVDAKGNIQIPPVLEFFTIQPADSFTVQLSNSIGQGQIQTQFDSKSANWMKIETSADGKTWSDANATQKGNTVSATLGQAFQWVRVTNSSNQPVQLRLHNFSIINSESAVEKGRIFTHDLNVFTAYDLPANTNLQAIPTITNAKQVVILTDSEDTSLDVDFQNSKGQWNSSPVTYGGNYITLNLPKATQSIRIHSKNPIRIFEVLWK